MQIWPVAEKITIFLGVNATNCRHVGDYQGSFNRKSCLQIWKKILMSDKFKRVASYCVEA